MSSVMSDELKASKHRIAELEQALAIAVKNLGPVAKSLKQRGFSASAASLRETIAVMRRIIRNKPKKAVRTN
jgi:hypothetical protein